MTLQNSAFCVFVLTLVGSGGCGRQAVPTIPVSEIAAASEIALESEPIVVAPDDWPWWRGPSGDGVSSEEAPPTNWSTTENVAWSAPVPGRGHSSPIVWGEKIFLTSTDGEQQTVYCYGRADGKSLWKHVAHEGSLPHMHRKNSHASGTPACDGQRIYSAFINGGGLYVTATDLDGKRLWQTEAGPFGSEHGYGSSPLLYKSLVIVNGDNRTGCFIAALDAASGKIVWRTARETTGRHGSYATPTIANVAGRTQLLISGMSSVASYNPSTGELYWTCAGPAEVTANTIAYHDDLVFVSGGYPEKNILAIRADGSGDVTDSHIVWQADKGVTYVPSPIYHEGRLFVVNDKGIASCLDAATGKEVWTKRVGGNFSSSPTLAGGLLFASDEKGRTTVFRAADAFEQVAVNELDSGIFATPTICGGNLFLRTENTLYCIGGKGSFE